MTQIRPAVAARTARRDAVGRVETKAADAEITGRTLAVSRPTAGEAAALDLGIEAAASDEK